MTSKERATVDQALYVPLSANPNEMARLRATAGVNAFQEPQVTRLVNTNKQPRSSRRQKIAMARYTEEIVLKEDEEEIDAETPADASSQEPAKADGLSKSLLDYWNRVLVVNSLTPKKDTGLLFPSHSSLRELFDAQTSTDVKRVMLTVCIMLQRDFEYLM
jgi:hypothetical protein